MRIRLAVIALIAAALPLVFGCKKSAHSGSSGSSSGSSGSSGGSGGSDPADDEPPPQFGLVIHVTDESGADLPAATIQVGNDLPVPVAPDGTLTLEDLDGPVLVVASAPGFIPEPAVLEIADSEATQEIRLRSSTGPAGARRVVMHFGGDAMLGRRYVTPVDDDTIVVTPGDGGASARKVVASLGPLYRAADISSVNVESVIGTLPSSAAYPGKLFVIQSIPEIVSMLDEMGVDVAVLGNNHVRDYLEPGIDATITALTDAGYATVGAGSTEALAEVPAIVAAGGMEVGFLSYSTITGDSANDNFPLDSDPVPPVVDPEDLFQYEFRSWGFTGASITVPTASRRIGSAWQIFVAEEPSASGPAEVAAFWASASSVYPELQDWLARRGHGGANRFLTSAVAPDVAALRTAGCDLVVVQIHGGHHTYSAFQSAFTQVAAYASIDAGADLVVGHHAHVLQGVEWYKGKLIVYSMGNCVFDQVFLQTFTSSVLRVVFEESTLLEARMYPTTIHRYSPMFVTGSSALDVTKLTHERSVIDAHADTFSGLVQSVLDTPDPSSVKPVFIQEGHSFRIAMSGSVTTPLEVDLDEDSAVTIPGASLTRSRSASGSVIPDLLLGRDLFRWGHFEDEAADGETRGGLHWSLPPADSGHKRIVIDGDSPSGSRVLHLERTASNTSRTRARPVARVSLLDHRLFNDLGGDVTSPADGPASYSIRLFASLSSGAPTSLILDVHNFRASVANEDAESTFLREVEIPFEVDSDGDWHELLIDLPAGTLDPVGGLEANQVMMYVALYPPDDGESVLHVDDIQFLEWREASLLPDAYFAADAVRSAGGAMTVLLEQKTK